ncbi:MAG TPA: hypothetical protein P5210_04675 [Draconibacterium sp.]|nr:hypothetical protein [Draconibacterium sp.]
MVKIFLIINRKTMKTMYKIFFMLIVSVVVFSCIEEEMIETDPSFVLSFERDGQTAAFAGTKFYVIPNGSGEFFTLFDGTEGHVWGEAGAKGIDFNKADSLSLNYSKAGKYNLTLVVSSAGDYGNDFSRNSKTIEITVVDFRNSFNAFNINGTDGFFADNNEIQFAVPDVVTDYNFVANFGINSPDAKVYVDGVEQTSGQTVNDFSQPVVYTIKSGQATEQKYTVKFSTFPASDEKAITKLQLGVGGNGEVGVIDQENKVINLTSNYATNLSSVRLIIASSFASTVYLNGSVYSDRKNYNLTSSGINEIKVVAQNKSEAVYSIITVLDKPVNTFTFAGLVPAPQGVIDELAKTITVDVLKGTDITNLIAVWTGSVGKVTVGTTTQVNGTTANNFSSPVTYTFYKGSTAGDKYKVTVNVK